MTAILGWSAIRRGEPPQNGFTLLELLVVLVILGLLAATVPPLVARAVPGAELKSAAREVAAALRYARSQAVTSGREVSFEMDVESRRYRITGGERDFALPAELDIAVFGAASVSPDDLTGGIRFFTDGSSTGGYVTIENKDHSYRVDVDWLVGQVTVYD